MRKNSKKLAESSVDLFEDLEQIKDSLAAITADVKTKTAEMLARSVESAKGKSAEIQENVDAYVTDRPYKFMGMAILTGIVLGYLLHKDD
jgi:ElaB/YqjD/DUF883 family membrane-anchored ribosome-binding protein